MPDAIREDQEAIASVLRKHGGLSGQDPRLSEAVKQHLQRPKDVALAKAQRRERNVSARR